MACGRRMEQAEVGGKHSYRAQDDTAVTIWRRGESYLGRGYLDGKRFGETLGPSPEEAEANLRRILHELDRGTYQRPSERPKSRKGSGIPRRIRPRELIDRFLESTRKRSGKKTAACYASRLRPFLDFLDRAENRRRYAYANTFERTFVENFRSYLHGLTVTRNGQPGGAPKPISNRQIHNVLVTCRGLFAWALSTDVRLLPPEMTNPFSRDIVGSRPTKDFRRDNPIPLETRIELVAHMGQWGLLHLGLLLVLPMRPSELAGLLVSEVDVPNRLLRFGTRFQGNDFTKGRQDFCVPYPPELDWLIERLIGQRAEGPLLSRKKPKERVGRASIQSAEDFERFISERVLENIGAATSVQDRKNIVRAAMREIGGVTVNELSRAMKRLFARTGIPPNVRPYDLRGAVTTEMYRAGVATRELAYLTSHAVSDTLAHYVAGDPVAEMAKYFRAIGPLLKRMKRRAIELGLCPADVKKEDWRQPFKAYDLSFSTDDSAAVAEDFADLGKEMLDALRQWTPMSINWRRRPNPNSVEPLAKCDLTGRSRLTMMME